MAVSPSPEKPPNTKRKHNNRPEAAPDNDEFGDINDDELISAETGLTTAQAGDQNVLNQHQSKKIKVESQLLEDDEQHFHEAAALARSILLKTWGFSAFRLKQEAAIARLIAGKSAVVVFLTGGGKSLVYQVPALAFNDWDELNGQVRGGGLTLVVSPLIALMKDQVDALQKRGVCAAAMDSSQSREVWLDSCEKIRSGELKLLYVAPERLNNEGFVEMISHTKIRLVAVDEAHCISQWGHAFRPDYLKIARFTKEIKAERVLCLTATATPAVASDICDAFDIPPQAVFRTPSYRSNLRLLAKSFNNNAEKEQDIVKFFRSSPGPSIVYVQTHEQTENVCAVLVRNQLAACTYHAGMSADARTAIQDRFMHSTNLITVATIAFGMGIDKSDIRNVIHYAIPKSLEGYSQEIGRAGRDGLPSTCMIYLCDEDIGIMEQWSRADVPSLRSVEGLVRELVETHRLSKPNDVIERNLYHESRDWDIKMNTLGLLNAQLELRYELLRAITPKYSEYKFTPSPSFDVISQDGFNVARVLRDLSTTKSKQGKWKHIDVDRAAEVGRFSRAQAVQKLQEWNDRGAIDLTASGVIHRFRLLSPLPTSPTALKTLTNDLHTHFLTTEASNISQTHHVIKFLTSPICLAKALAAHFGDELGGEISANNTAQGGCANCSFCIEGKALVYERKEDRGRRGRIDEEKFQKVLEATAVRDDARFLARVAFGISSPRVTREKLGKSDVFGSLGGCDFEELVERFEEVCSRTE